MSTGFSSAAIPNAPTIGTATATSDVAATITYTAAVLGATGTTFTATSNPSSITGTGSSPITVTGLTASTSYTFTVTAGNANGTSAASSASNSITTSAPLNSYESIATATVGSGGQSTVTFSSIPSTYTHLQIRSIGRTNRDSVFDDLRLKINTDTGNSFYRHFLYGTGGAGALGGNQTGVLVGAWGGGMTGANAQANVFAAAIVDILDYANTNKNKTIRGFDGFDNNGDGIVALSSSLWSSTSAINSIEISAIGGTIQQYSSFALYGIKGA
jgi:hypothetical protein